MNSTPSKQAVPWFVLLSRSLFFLCSQALVALIAAAAGKQASWTESARWWPIWVVLANCVSLALLVVLFRAEGKRYLDLIRFSRETWKADLAWFFGSSIVGLPIVSLPMNLLAPAIFGDRMVPIEMMFRPLPGWALLVGILFPITVGLVELPTYFGYAMPRLFSPGKPQTPAPWAAWLIASFFLGAQHVFLPFLPDGRFMLWRLGMYMPFALFVGLLLKLRPTLLPYTMIIHVLADFSALAVYLMV